MMLLNVLSRFLENVGVRRSLASLTSLLLLAFFSIHSSAYVLSNKGFKNHQIDYYLNITEHPEATEEEIQSYIENVQRAFDIVADVPYADISFNYKGLTDIAPKKDDMFIVYFDKNKQYVPGHGVAGYFKFDNEGYTTSADIMIWSHINRISSPNNLTGLVLHELLHVIGLGHALTGADSAVYNNTINLSLSTDDIAGVSYLYPNSNNPISDSHASVNGKLIFSSGEPAQGTVLIKNGDSRILSIDALADGEFHLTGIPEGNYYLQVIANPTQQSNIIGEQVDFETAYLEKGKVYNIQTSLKSSLTPFSYIGLEDVEFHPRKPILYNASIFSHKRYDANTGELQHAYNNGADGLALSEALGLLVSTDQINKKVRIFDVNELNDTFQYEIASLDTLSQPTNLDILGNFAFVVTNGGQALHIVNLKDTTIAHTLNDLGFIQDVHIDETTQRIFISTHFGLWEKPRRLYEVIFDVNAPEDAYLSDILWESHAHAFRLLTFNEGNNIAISDRESVIVLDTNNWEQVKLLCDGGFNLPLISVHVGEFLVCLTKDKHDNYWINTIRANNLTEIDSFIIGSTWTYSLTHNPYTNEVWASGGDRGATYAFTISPQGKIKESVKNPVHPTHLDSDGDGLSDEAERQFWTSPTLSDTDADGISDFNDNFNNIPSGHLNVDYDFDGDGKSDVGFARSSNGIGYSYNSSLTFFGSNRKDIVQRQSMAMNDTDIPVSGDFDGDGIADKGIWDPISLRWRINLSSSKETKFVLFGEDHRGIPVIGDYDGDGIADLALRYPDSELWHIKNSSGVDPITHNGNGETRLAFGRFIDDIPVVGDYDGDGRADIAIYRPGNLTWYIRNSSRSDRYGDDQNGITRLQHGNTNAIPVPGDYDGDGLTDIAYRNPQTFDWIVINSAQFNQNRRADQYSTTYNFGLHEDDIPVVGDYDGDGRDDIAVRRPKTRTWYIKNSSGEDIYNGADDGISRLYLLGRSASDIPFAAPPSIRMSMTDRDLIDTLVLLRDTSLTFPVGGQHWSNTTGSDQHREIGYAQRLFDDDFAFDLNLTSNNDSGVNVYPVADGRIIASDVDGLGFVLIEHTDPILLNDGSRLETWYSGYMHMTNVIDVTPEDGEDVVPVTTNTILGEIGDVGLTGDAVDHLHFAIYQLEDNRFESIDVANNLNALTSNISTWYDWCGDTAVAHDSHWWEIGELPCEPSEPDDPIPRALNIAMPYSVSCGMTEPLLRLDKLISDMQIEEN